MDIIIDYVNQHFKHFKASECIYHRKRMCFLMFSTFNDKVFHTLHDNSSKKWFPYANSLSCDIPHFVNKLIMLKKVLNDLVPTFSTFFRSPLGSSFFLFEISNSHYTKPFDISTLGSTVLVFIIMLSEISYLLNGSCPNITDMKFIYTDKYPIIVDVGKKNCLRELQTFSHQSWQRYVTKTKTTSLLKFMKFTYPECFQVKRKKSNQCILKGDFDDWTHILLCKGYTFKEILEKYVPRDFPLKAYCDNILNKLDT